MNKIKIYDLRIYVDLDTENYEADVMETNMSRSKNIRNETQKLFELICKKSDKKLKEEEKIGG